jgi:hypothetical protein
LAETILGVNRRSGRLQQNVLNKNIYIDTAVPYLASFTDTGLFGVKLSGSAANAKEVLEAAVNELKSLTKITNE